MIPIGETKGYKLLYDEERKLFILEDAEGDEVASAATQDEVAVLATKLSKQAFNFPIPALRITGLSLAKGRITSVNTGMESAFFSFDDKFQGNHLKLHLRWDHAFELTKANSRVYGQVEECRQQIREIEGKIKNLLTQLEKPINRTYFEKKEGF